MNDKEKLNAKLEKLKILRERIKKNKIEHIKEENRKKKQC